MITIEDLPWTWLAWATLHLIFVSSRVDWTANKSLGENTVPTSYSKRNVLILIKSSWTAFPIANSATNIVLNHCRFICFTPLPQLLSPKDYVTMKCDIVRHIWGKKKHYRSKLLKKITTFEDWLCANSNSNNNQMRKWNFTFCSIIYFTGGYKSMKKAKYS